MTDRRGPGLRLIPPQGFIPDAAAIGVLLHVSPAAQNMPMRVIPLPYNPGTHFPRPPVIASFSSTDLSL